MSELLFLKRLPLGGGLSHRLTRRSVAMVVVVVIVVIVVIVRTESPLDSS